MPIIDASPAVGLLTWWRWCFATVFALSVDWCRHQAASPVCLWCSMPQGSGKLKVDLITRVEKGKKRCGQGVRWEQVTGTERDHDDGFFVCRGTGIYSHLVIG